MDIFDAIKGGNTAHTETAVKLGADIKEAVRQLMTRREGRVFVAQLINTTNDINTLRGLSQLVLAYTEGIHA